jgi:hypothetical protein
LPSARTTHPPVIDGNLNDLAWKEVSRAMRFIDPITGKPASEQTEAWLVYDDTAIYAAFHCHDSEPASIVAREIRYGADLSNDDTVSFSIDPHFTRTGGGTSVFTVSAGGTQADFIAGGRAAKREWRGLWQAAARRVADGWTAEIRIPWSVLNYPPGTARTFGINFSRFQSRLHATSEWSNTTEVGRPEFIGQWQGVNPPKDSHQAHLQEMVYVSPDWTASSSATLHAGIDMRYRPDSQITGVFSLFPDLRNIERAVEGIQFTRSERYVGETRPFFVEGRRFFAPLFYSPRISEFDAGAKAFGRLNSHVSFGLLTVERAFSDNATVGNFQYSLAEHGSVAAFGTLRHGPANDHEGYGGAATFISGLWSVGVQTMRAREGSSGGSTFESALSYAARHVSLQVGAGTTDRDYSPSLGFVPFRDERNIGSLCEFHSEYRTGPLRDVDIQLSGERITHQDGSFFQDGASVFGRCTTRRDYAFSFSRHVGRFESAHDNTCDLSVTGCASNRFRTWSLDYEWGILDDHSVSQWLFELDRRLFRKLDIGVSGTILRHAGDNEQYIATIGWEFNARNSLSGRLVQQGGALNWYVAFRSGGGVGQDFYVIVGDPNAPRFTSRVALKWVWAN